MTYCKCGKLATHITYLPVTNVYTGLRQVYERYFVCDYHAEKSRIKGFSVNKIKY